MDQAVLSDILEIGLCAISTCNIQPWRFRFREQTLEIYALRTKNFFLKLEGNTWLELGTLIENIAVAAASKGLSIDYRLYEKCGLDEPAACLKFIPATAAVKADIESVRRRCTNRNCYGEAPLPPQVQQSIREACDDSNIGINILTGRKKVECAKILANLEHVRSDNLRLIEEVFPYLRFDPAEISAHRDCLDARAMGLDPVAFFGLKFAKKYPVLMPILHGAMKSLGLLKRQKIKFEKLLVQSGALIALTISKRDQQSYVNLGRVTQRILNGLTAQKVATYVIVSGLYLLDILKENLEIYSKNEQIRLLQYQYDLQTFFSFTDRRVALFVRAGYADPPKFRTLRKHVREVMIDDKGNALSQ